MLKNYLKTAFRSLIKDKVYSFINIVGLAIGISASLLICVYVLFEKSYDDFYTQKDQIYRLRVEGLTDAGEMQFQSARCYPIVGPMVKELYPEILEQARFVAWEDIIRIGDPTSQRKIEYWENKAAYADPAFLDIFDVEIIEGSRDAFEGVNKVLISKSTSIKYFGEESALGKIINLNNEKDMQVVGVYRDVPKNSHLKYNLLITYASLGGGIFEYNWGWNGFFTYLVLEKGTDPAALEAEFVKFIYKHKGDYFRSTEYHEDLLLQPLANIHLYSNFEDEAELNGNYKSVNYLSILAVFIIIIAWVNYVNLTTAKSINRAKEVGIRKTTGATRTQLVWQFLTESAIINLTALLLAVTIAQTCIPIFQDLLEGNFVDSIFAYNNLTIVISLFWLVSSILSGLYPAFILSAFDPVMTLKGSFRSTTGGKNLRKGLIIVQFVTSIVLIAATYIVYTQVQYMRQVDLGVNIDQKLVIRGPNYLPDSIKGVATFDHYYRLINSQIKQTRNIESMTISESIPGSKIYEWGGYIRRKGAPYTEARAYYLLGVSPNYPEFFDFEIIKGRSFNEDLVTDHHSILINEEAMKNLGFNSADEAVEAEIHFPFGGKQDESTARIIGIVKNFHQMSLKDDYKPMIYHLENSDLEYFTFKVSAGKYKETIDYLEGVWNDLFPATPYDYFFLDGFFDKQYKSEIRFGILFSIFSGLSLVIACMGMFGLTSFSVIQRTKEVGIRKALGAPMSSLVFLLSNELIKLLIISSFIAIPLAYFALNQWLLEFPFRITIEWWYFLIPVAMVMIVAMVSVSYKIFRSAMSNPVESLRYE